MAMATIQEPADLCPELFLKILQQLPIRNIPILRAVNKQWDTYCTIALCNQFEIPACVRNSQGNKIFPKINQPVLNSLNGKCIIEWLPGYEGQWSRCKIFLPITAMEMHKKIDTEAHDPRWNELVTQPKCTVNEIHYSRYSSVSSATTTEPSQRQGKVSWAKLLGIDLLGVDLRADSVPRMARWPVPRRAR